VPLVGQRHPWILAYLPSCLALAVYSVPATYLIFQLGMDYSITFLAHSTMMSANLSILDPEEQIESASRFVQTAGQNLGIGKKVPLGAKVTQHSHRAGQ